MGMERADQIMRTMGFRKDSSEAVKIAFVKNLIKQTYGVDVRTPLQMAQTEKRTDMSRAQSDVSRAQQMSFDFEKVG